MIGIIPGSVTAAHHGNMFKKIMVALDGSPEALGALEPARSLARAFDAELHLVAVEFPHTPKGAEWELTQDAYLDKKSKELQDYLDGWAEKLRAEGLNVTTSVLPIGSTIARLQLEVREFGADLLVLCSHGRSGWSRLVYGSTAEEMNRRVACPVMVVPL